MVARYAEMTVQAARRPVIAAGRNVHLGRCLTGQSSTGVHPAKTRNISSSARRSSVVSDTVDSMVAKLASTKGQEASKEDGLRLLVFGKPGSGKGTLSSRLVEQYDIAFVSTGDVLRKEIMAQSEVGRRAEEVVASGGLVSDELMLDVVKTELDRLRGKSWIIDGFPRTLAQGELLDSVLNQEGRPLNMIVHLNVPDSVIMARISARWVHLPSGRVYNTTYSAPKVPGIDDVTGEPLSKRPDDTPVNLAEPQIEPGVKLNKQETFSKRLSAYYASTAPLLEYFSRAYPDSLKTLSGSSSDEVLIAADLKTPPKPSPSPDPFPPDFPDSAYARNPSLPACSSSSSSSSSACRTRPDDCAFSSSATCTSTIDQLWPQLQALVEPFGLRRRKAHEADSTKTDEVRAGADDLRDRTEEVVERERKIVRQ